MSEPTRQGLYWALRPMSDEWETVLVGELLGSLVVFTLGQSDDYPLSDFTFGPEVTKPDEELE